VKISCLLICLILCSCKAEVPLAKEVVPYEEPLAHLNFCSDKEVLGEWAAVGDTFNTKFKSNCTYVDEACKSSGNFKTLGNGTIKLSIVSKDASVKTNCLPVGLHQCVYMTNTAVSPHQLSVTCGSFADTYSKVAEDSASGLEANVSVDTVSE
jgi:hypothetical protein